MEDNSYVNLSLEKYNELYDKAKKFDELSKELSDKIGESINTIVDNFNKMFTTDEEHSGETEQQEETEQDSKYNVELIEDTDCIPKGAKGIILQLDSDYPFVEWDKHYLNCYTKEVHDITYENVWAVPRESLKSINNKED